MIKIDDRLKSCADLVDGTGTVCDVGTDHAHLCVYLIQANICSNVIASDVVDGPLKSAEQTIKRYSLNDKIKLVKSDGLKNIDLHSVSDVVIAGLGGETILSIIRNEPLLKTLNISLILQPMTKAPLLRKELYSDGFEIVKEIPSKVGDTFYTTMKVSYTGFSTKLPEYTAKIGKVNFNDELSKEYGLYKVRSLNKLIDSLKFSNTDYSTLQQIVLKTEKLATGELFSTLQDVYSAIDSVAKFSTQEKWDNSGILIGNPNSKVSKVLVTLDITNSVIDEAIQGGYDTIVSHHPVIFNPIKSILSNSIEYKLIQHGINAICCHTPLDMAKGGINDILYSAFKVPLSLLEDATTLEVCTSDGLGFGKIVSTNTTLTPKQIAYILKDILNCTVVKYINGDRPIKKIAWCSGSGGSMLEEVLNMGADAYITGDIKHDRWLYAKDNGISLFDCGHFHTENIVLPYLRQIIFSTVPNVEVSVANSSCDVVEYAI